MRHFKSFGLTSLLAIAIAGPASAQMTPESVWAVMEDYLGKSGAEVTVGESRRDGDRLIISKVTLNAPIAEQNGSTSFEVPEIVLRDMGDGRVEVITATESVAKSSITNDSGEKVDTLITLRQEDNRTIVSGTEQKPVFDFSAKRVEVVQKIEADPSAVPYASTVTGDDIAGNVKLDLSVEPQHADYNVTMAKLAMLSVGTLNGEDGEADTTFEAEMSLEDMKAAYVGTLPIAEEGNTEELSKIEGKLDFAHGPFSLRVKSDGASAMDATFFSSASELKLDLAALAVKFGYDIKGLDVSADGPLPADAASKSNLSAVGEIILPPAAASALGLTESYGKVSLSLTAMTPLLDRVVAAKLASAEDIEGVKLMMSFFTQPGTEPDSVKLDLEQTKEGKTLINGEEMP